VTKIDFGSKEEYVLDEANKEIFWMPKELSCHGRPKET
jgi:hypothetical protein